MAKENDKKETTMSLADLGLEDEVTPAEAAKKNPDLKVYLTGYADSATGTEEINNRISAQRAESVAQTLEKLGVSRSQMVISSKGGVSMLENTAYDRRVIVEVK